jgi:acyl carrier protein
MSLNQFIEIIEIEFDEVAPGTIQGDTEFRKLNGWSSMMALIIVSKINKSYKVNISAQELAAAKTINDLYQLTISKLQSVS